MSGFIRTRPGRGVASPPRRPRTRGESSATILCPAVSATAAANQFQDLKWPNRRCFSEAELVSLLGDGVQGDRTTGGYLYLTPPDLTTAFTVKAPRNPVIKCLRTIAGEASAREGGLINQRRERRPREPGSAYAPLGLTASEFMERVFRYHRTWRGGTRRARLN